MDIVDDVLESVGQRLKNPDDIGRINKFVVDNEPKLFAWCTDWVNKQLGSITTEVSGLPPNFIMHLRNLLVSNVIVGHVITSTAYSKIFASELRLDTKDVLFNGDNTAMIEAWKAGALDDEYYDKDLMKEKGLSVEALGKGWTDAVSAHDSRKDKTRKVVADSVLSDILSTAPPPNDSDDDNVKVTI